jgi:hypothetical protein
MRPCSRHNEEKERVTERFAERIRRAPQSGRSLGEVVLEQKSFSERRTDDNLVLACQGPGTKHRREQLDGVGASPPFERRLRPAEYPVYRSDCHREEYTKYAARQLDIDA